MVYRDSASRLPGASPHVCGCVLNAANRCVAPGSGRTARHGNGYVALTLTGRNGAGWAGFCGLWCRFFSWDRLPSWWVKERFSSSSLFAGSTITLRNSM